MKKLDTRGLKACRHLDAVPQLLNDAASRELPAKDIVGPALDELQQAKQILASTMDAEGTQ
jgi:hypothetical protein